MKEQSNVTLLESLEQLTTPQLDDMLRVELEKELPEEHTVRLILKVLRAREADFPVVRNGKIDAALDTYRRKVSPAADKPRKSLHKAAAIAILCSLILFSLPQNAEARGLFDRIAAWTESIFELISHGDPDNPSKEYVFRTEHPGLQELHDTLVDLGVTTPVVPTWMDPEYQYSDCMITNTPITKKVRSTFSGEKSEAVFEVNIYSDSIPREFHKKDQPAEIYELNGIHHYIFRNKEMWTVVWAKDNIECSIVIECQEEVLYKILDSIYTVED